MKKTLIGGFISLIGTLWAIAISFIAGSNLASGWATPPGRFLTTVSELNLTIPFVISIILTFLGIIIMAAEFFRKEQ